MNEQGPCADLDISSWLEGILRPAHACHPGDTLCLDVGDRPLLSNIRHGLIDPDTPEDAHTMTSVEGKELKLVVCSPK